MIKITMKVVSKTVFIPSEHILNSSGETCETIGNNFNWKFHIKHTQSKVSRSSAILRKAKKVLERIIHKAGYQHYTNSLFMQSNILKISDLVSFQTAHIMFKAKNMQLHTNKQNMFSERRSIYNLGETFFSFYL